MIELLFIGASVGVLSGFFGIGGGTILIPLLLFAGFETKVAIGISIVQMVFSSIFGSYLNAKKGTLDISTVFTIGIGGFIGAFFSGYIASFLSASILEILFFFFVLFALSRLFFHSPKEHIQQKEASKVTLLLLGIVIGLFSMLIGVGGSVMLVPILVGFLHFPLKNATSAGLFFVVFSSISGLISHIMQGHIDFKSGIIVGIASLFGVYGGIWLKHKLSDKVAKRLLLFFYLCVIIYLFNRIFLSATP